MIIDSHVHLVTARMVTGAKRRFDAAFPGVLDRSIKKGRATINEEMIHFLKKSSIETLAEMWIEELDRNKIDRALISAYSWRLHGRACRVYLHPA